MSLSRADLIFLALIRSGQFLRSNRHIFQRGGQLYKPNKPTCSHLAYGHPLVRLISNRTFLLQASAMLSARESLSLR